MNPKVKDVDNSANEGKTATRMTGSSTTHHENEKITEEAKVIPKKGSGKLSKRKKIKAVLCEKPSDSMEIEGSTKMTVKEGIGEPSKQQEQSEQKSKAFKSKRPKLVIVKNGSKLPEEKTDGSSRDDSMEIESDAGRKTVDVTEKTEEGLSNSMKTEKSKLVKSIKKNSPSAPSDPFSEGGFQKRGHKRTFELPMLTNDIGKSPPSKRQETLENNSSNRKLDGVGTGSFKKYYHRRVSEKKNHHDGNSTSKEDDRIPLIKKVIEKYQCDGQKPCVLDVGCNDGTLTLQIGQLPQVSEVVGIDLDKVLILRARNALRELVFDAKHESKRRVSFVSEENKTSTESNLKSAKINSNSSSTHDTTKESKPSSKNDGIVSPKFPFNVTFRNEDIVEDNERTTKEKGKYDIIVCLSVTKWVHMKHRDEGLKRLFSNIKDCLKDDGCLILEPQLARSYKLARKKGLGPKDFDLGKCVLKPGQFGRYLVTDGGFKSMEKLRDVRKGQPFNRPVIAFYKSINKELVQNNVDGNKAIKENTPLRIESRDGDKLKTSDTNEGNIDSGKALTLEMNDTNDQEKD